MTSTTRMSNVLRFATGGPELVLALDETRPTKLLATADPQSYVRLRDEALFGEHPDIEPINADEPVQVTLAWVGSGLMPGAPDAVLLEAPDWKLLEASQEHDGIRVGYSNEAPQRLSNAVLDFLAADGWEANRIGETIHTRYAGTSGELACEIHTDEAREILVTIAVLPIAVPPGRRAAVDELALRLTYRMDIGAVDVSPAGAVSVRHGVDVEGVELTAATVRNAIYPVVTQAERWLPLLQQVIDGGTAEDAVESVS
jgi:hypothetical protein